VQHAVGLFETMHACATETEPEGRVFRLAEHMARLQTSARELGLSDDLKVRPLGEAIEAVVKESKLATGTSAARVRVTVTGGDLNLLQAGAGQSHDPTIIIHATPATPYPHEMFERGVTATIADTKVNPLNRHESHKTVNYWWRLRELQQAAQRGAAEAIVLQVTNHVAGGCVSNLFVVKDGLLLTPIARGEEGKGAIPSPVLPGVTRGAILEIAKSKAIPVTTRLLTIDDVLDADELFLTNASFGVLPIVQVERKKVGVPIDQDTLLPEPGPTTRKLRAALFDWRAFDV
jgi:branched-subunit amino acid aminotransferase/4-amino-4-deoxychorismate lyase